MNVGSKTTIGVLAAAVAFSAMTAHAQSTAKPAATTPTQTKPAPAKPAATTPATQKPATAKPTTAKPAAPNAALRTPAKLKDVAPATYRANFETSVGVFVVEVTKAWAPKGADRFYNLVKYGYFDGNRFFRVVKNFMVQFGINGDPKLNEAWRQTDITDDPVTQSNKKGYITFATRGPNSRTTQVFINFKDNAFLDSQGLRAVRSDRGRSGGRRQAERRIRGAAESDAGADPVRRERVSGEELPAARLHQESDHREAGGSATAREAAGQEVAPQ